MVLTVPRRRVGGTEVHGGPGVVRHGEHRSDGCPASGIWASFRQSASEVQTTPVWEYHCVLVRRPKPQVGTAHRDPAPGTQPEFLRQGRLRPPGSPSVTAHGARPRRARRRRPRRWPCPACLRTPSAWKRRLADTDGFGTRRHRRAPTTGFDCWARVTSDSVNEALASLPAGAPKAICVRREGGEGRRRLVAEARGQPGEHDEQECDEGDDRSHEGEASLGKADIADGEKHGVPFGSEASCGVASSLPRRRARGIGPRMDRRHRSDDPRSTEWLIPPGAGVFRRSARRRRHYAGSMEGDAGNTVHNGTGPRGAPHAGAGHAGAPQRAGAHRGGRHSARPSREPARRLCGAAPGGAAPAPGRRHHWARSGSPCCWPAARRRLPRGHRAGETARRPPDPVRSAALLGLVAGRRLPPVAAAGLGQCRLRLAGLPAVLPAAARAPAPAGAAGDRTEHRVGYCGALVPQRR